jgi:hypothetical protein
VLSIIMTPFRAEDCPYGGYSSTNVEKLLEPDEFHEGNAAFGRKRSQETRRRNRGKKTKRVHDEPNPSTLLTKELGEEKKRVALLKTELASKEEQNQKLVAEFSRMKQELNGKIAGMEIKRALTFKLHASDFDRLKEKCEAKHRSELGRLLARISVLQNSNEKESQKWIAEIARLNKEAETIRHDHDAEMNQLVNKFEAEIDRLVAKDKKNCQEADAKIAALKVEGVKNRLEYADKVARMKEEHMDEVSRVKEEEKKNRQGEAAENVRLKKELQQLSKKHDHLQNEVDIAFQKLTKAKVRAKSLESRVKPSHQATTIIDLCDN